MMDTQQFMNLLWWTAEAIGWFLLFVILYIVGWRRGWNQCAEERRYVLDQIDARRREREACRRAAAKSIETAGAFIVLCWVVIAFLLGTFWREVFHFLGRWV